MRLTVMRKNEKDGSTKYVYPFLLVFCVLYIFAHSPAIVHRAADQ